MYVYDYIRFQLPEAYTHKAWVDKPELTCVIVRKMMEYIC